MVQLQGDVDPDEDAEIRRMEGGEQMVRGRMLERLREKQKKKTRRQTCRRSLWMLHWRVILNLNQKEKEEEETTFLRQPQKLRLQPCLSLSLTFQ